MNKTACVSVLVPATNHHRRKPFRQCLERLGGSALLALVVALLVATGTGAQRSQPILVEEAARQARATDIAANAYGRLPLHFEPNRGQTDPQVRFVSRVGGHALLLGSTEVVLVTQQPGVGTGAAPGRNVLRMRLVGANPDPQVVGRDRLPGKVNYFVGNRDRWRTDIPIYARVEYQEVYPGIDVLYYGNQRQLEHDFIVAPAADPDAITVTFTGAEAIEINPQGDLVVKSGDGEVRWSRPVAYQEGPKGRREPIPAEYDLNPGADGPDPRSAVPDASSTTVGFQLAAYDTTRPLVIDPVLFYSTPLGGDMDDSGSGIAVDAQGHAYVTGSTLSTNFPPPATTIPPTLAKGGSGDVFVARLDPSGASLVYATYFGGNDEDRGDAVAVNGMGQAYVTGATRSDAVNEAFPVSAGAFDTSCGTDGFCDGESDAFVATLSPSGTLLYASYLGAAKGDFGFGIAVDSLGNAYVAGTTIDHTNTFPVTAGAFQTVDPHLDGFMTKLAPNDTNVNVPCTLAGIQYNDCADLLYSTYINALDQDDEAFGVAVDGLGNVYIAGWTGADGFPTKNAFQSAKAAGRDVFVLKLRPDNLNTNQPCTFSDPDFVYNDCADLLYSSYFGGGGQDSLGDQANDVAIAVDGAGFLYVTGGTASTDFPGPGGTAPKLGAGTEGEGRDAFVAKFDPSASGDASLVYAVYLGGTGAESGRGIAVDNQGNAYVAGQTGSPDFPGSAGGTAPKLGFGTPGQSGDVFVATLNAAGDALLSSAYVGGSASEGGVAVALDASCNAYVTGGTFSTDFPRVNPLPADPANDINVATNGDAVVAKIAQLGFRAYIGQFDDGGVSVIDTHTNSIVGDPIALGTLKPEGVAVHPDGTRVYVSNLVSSSVSVIDAVANTLLGTVPLGASRNPIGVAVHPGGAWVYVANSGVPPEKSVHTISVIDTATNTLAGEIDLGILSQANVPFGIAVHPDGTKLYVANLNGNFVSVINVDTTVDPATYTFGETVSVGTQPRGVAVSANGARVYVANGSSGTVSVIDTATNDKINFSTASTDIAVGNGPFGVAAHPTQNKVYVTNANDDTVSVLTFSVAPPTPPTVTTVAVGDGPRGVAVTPDGSLVYVANVFGDSVSVINAANGTRIVFTSVDANMAGDLAVGDGPVALGQFIGFPVFDADGDFIEDFVDGEIVAGVFVDKSQDAGNMSFTNQHLCGTVAGTITSVPPGMTLAVARPAGIEIGAVGGSGQAQVNACGFEMLYDPADVAVINSCGSLNTHVRSGPVEILVGSAGVVTVPSGVTVRVADVRGNRFEVRHLEGAGTIIVALRGQVRELRPGTSRIFALGRDSSKDRSSKVRSSKKRSSKDSSSKVRSSKKRSSKDSSSKVGSSKKRSPKDRSSKGKGKR